MAIESLFRDLVKEKIASPQFEQLYMLPNIIKIWHALLIVQSAELLHVEEAKYTLQ